MSIKSDRWIKEMATSHKMIEPFADEQIRGGISFGVSSYGYDFRISNRFKVFDPPKNFSSIDPKNSNDAHFRDVTADVCEIPAHGYVLGQTVEYFRIPRDVITVCFGKSTYARAGIFINVTPFEPEWEGFATIAISNMTRFPARIYAGEGIGQLLFIGGSEVCEKSYADKKGKYQAQKKITIAKGKG